MNEGSAVVARTSATIGEAIGEIERELRVRDSVYPRLVVQGKLTQGEADRRRKAMRVGLYYLEAVAREQAVGIPNSGERV